MNNVLVKTDGTKGIRARTINLTGQIFGQYTVSCEIARRVKDRFYSCTCSCGNVREVSQRNLRSGNSTSCGCLRDFRPGRKRLHQIWANMHQRCNNTNSPHYEDYGAKGVTLDPAWGKDFAVFYNWSISRGYADDYSIDRRDGRLGYSPENCRWVPQFIQSVNRAPSIRSSSGYRNISKTGSTYLVWICYLGIRHTVGTYANILNAVVARNKYYESNGLLWHMEAMKYDTTSLEELLDTYAQSLVSTPKYLNSLGGMYLCYCTATSHKEFLSAVTTLHITKIKQVIKFNVAGGFCKKCYPAIVQILKDINKESE